MLYRSTRGGESDVSFLDAVLKGMSVDGGLFIPQTAPKAGLKTYDETMQWKDLSYSKLAFEVLSLFISREEVPADVLRELCEHSYDAGQWRDVAVCPNVEIPIVEAGKLQAEKAPKALMLELFHGPTFAFKDAALQFLGNLFQFVLKKREKRSAIILGATSGDTGSAAVAGVRGKDGVHGLILYPNKRVSRIQELQMLSFNVNNANNVVQSCAVEDATFDCCQAIVKSIFQDKDFVAKNNVLAVNSINIARVLAQMVYYLWCYFRAKDRDTENNGDMKYRFSVPTGNFGDILAGYYCRRYLGMADKFEMVVASNSNDILTRFFQTGSYSCNGVSQTLSPSMDIQVSSNFERFLFDVVQCDCARVKILLDDLKAKGSFMVTPEELAEAQRHFSAVCASEDQTVDAIYRVYKAADYLMCPHTAVGYHAMIEDRKQVVNDGTKRKYVVLATAHFGKFVNSLEDHLKNDTSDRAKELLKVCRELLPKALADLEVNSDEITKSATRMPKNVEDVRAYIEKIQLIG